MATKLGAVRVQSINSAACFQQVANRICLLAVLKYNSPEPFCGIHFGFRKGLLSSNCIAAWCRLSICSIMLASTTRHGSQYGSLITPLALKYHSSCWCFCGVMHCSMCFCVVKAYIQTPASARNDLDTTREARKLQPLF